MVETKIPLAMKMASALTQQRLGVALKFSVITLAVLALYFQDLNMVFTGALTNETTFHILAIPFLFAYLIFRKRKMILATIQSPKAGINSFQKNFSVLAGISLSAVAIVTYWYGSYSFTPLEYHILTLPFLAAGLILILFNVQTLKQLLFPLAFLIFLTPPPDEILYGFGSALANLSAAASNGLANVFGLHATLSANLGSPVITLLKPDHTTLSFGVDVACSGIYSLIGFLIFALFIAYILRGKLTSKLAVLIIGIPLIVALNIIRITAILGIGYNFGEDLGLQLFHTVGATVLMFIGTLLLLAITDKAFKKPKPLQPCPTCSPTSTKPAQPFCLGCGKLFKTPKIKLTRIDIAKIISIAIIVVLLLSIQAPVFALTKGPAQVVYQTPSGTQVNTNSTSSLLPNVAGYTLNYAYRDTVFEQASGDDAALVYSYSPHSETASTVWVTIQIAPSTTSEHRWETCLVNWPLSQGDPATVNQIDLRDVQIQDNPPMAARYFAFEYKDSNQSEVVFYWYETATFDTNGTAQTKSVMMSVIMYPSSPSSPNIAEQENQELVVAQAINSYWQPIQAWSVVSLALSQNGLVLTAVAISFLIALLIYKFNLDYRDRSSLKTLYNKLAKQNQQIIQAVANAEKQGNPTFNGIASELGKITNTTVESSWLDEKLQEAENAGLIAKKVVNREDQPAVAWHTSLLKIVFFSKIKDFFIPTIGQLYKQLKTKISP
jgi:exosortase